MSGGIRAERGGRRRGFRLHQVSERMHFVQTSFVNWAIYVGSDGVTLIDSGYEAQRGILIASLIAVGCRPEDVTAVLITHGHADHIGGAARLARDLGTAVYTHAQRSITCDEPRRSRPASSMCSVASGDPVSLGGRWRYCRSPDSTRGAACRAHRRCPSTPTGSRCQEDRATCTSRVTRAVTPYSTSKTRASSSSVMLWPRGIRSLRASGRNCCRRCSTTMTKRLARLSNGFARRRPASRCPDTVTHGSARHLRLSTGRSPPARRGDHSTTSPWIEQESRSARRPT